MARKNCVITAEMMDVICDKLCRYPHETEDQDALEDICCECPIAQYICELDNKDHEKE